MLYWTRPTIVRKQVQLISNYFTTSSAGQEAGRTGAGGNKIKAYSARAWAELGKIQK